VGVALVLSNGALQVLLLVVELVLLVATLSLLVLNRRESEARGALMKRFSSVADVITRQEYFVAVIDAVQRSQKSLVGMVTGSPPSNEEGEVIRQILNAIAEAAKKGVAIRYLLPLVPDRLRMGRLYTRSGAQVKFSPSVLISDARYSCVDGKLVLVGIPDRSGRNEPTRKGYAMASESVARLFVRDFEEQWGAPGAMSYEDYLRRLAGEARASNPSASAELIAGNLGVGKEDIESALAAASQRKGAV
jgi:phosphatidylserine/phosphatidylglycerophosphate/cardiolipin synthase-like enzyme